MIIPAQASEPDIREAIVIAKDVRAMSSEIGQDIPYRMLLTKMFPLRTRFGDHALAELERLKMPCFRTFLVERSAYREMFLSGEPPTMSEKGKGAGAEIDSSHSGDPAMSSSASRVCSTPFDWRRRGEHEWT